MDKTFSVGQKIVWITDDRVDGYQEHPGIVKEVYDDHIIVNIPEFNDHCWFDKEDYDFLKMVN